MSERATVSRESWVAALLWCVNTPFAHQGRLPGVGMDCPGPMIWAARHLGLVDAGFDETGYPRAPDGSLQPTLDRHLMRVDRAALQLGDVVLNAFRLQPPRHVAYVVGELYGQWELMHACAVRGKVIVERIDYGRYYRFVQGYAVPGVQ